MSSIHPNKSILISCTHIFTSFITTNSSSVCIGYKAGATQGNLSQALFIARNGTGKGNASTWIYGDDQGRCYQGNNSSSWSTTSDRRIKKNIEDNITGLDAINGITVRNFEYRTKDEITDFDNVDSAVVNKEGVQVGVIAQEIETILPDVVKEESTGVKTVDPDNMTWYLVNAVKELSAEVEKLKTKLNEGE
jgi:hypothetical protein